MILQYKIKILSSVFNEHFEGTLILVGLPLSSISKHYKGTHSHFIDFKSDLSLFIYLYIIRLTLRLIFKKFFIKIINIIIINISS